MGLDTVELILSVEQTFDISITDAATEKIITVGDLHEYVVAELIRQNRPNINHDVTYDLLRNLICFQLDVEPEKVVPCAEFIRDLHAD